jgi:hypothetical protein
LYLLLHWSVSRMGPEIFLRTFISKNYYL